MASRQIPPGFAPRVLTRSRACESYPPRKLLSRAFYEVVNLGMRLTRSSFRGFATRLGDT
jgi:hypothetical protein